MRKLCWAAASFSAAVFLAVYLLPESFLLPAAGSCALLGSVAWLLRGNTRRRAILAALGLAFGFFWTGCYNTLVRTPARALIGKGIQDYTLVVTDFPRETSRGASLPATLLEAGVPHAKIQLYADREALALRPGDVVRAPVRLSPSDFLRGETVEYYQARGVYLLGYAQESLTLDHRPGSIPLCYFPQNAAQALKTSILRIFSEDVSGFLIALLTGDKAALPTGLYAAFQRSGLSHAIAVSGLHIGFLAGLLTLLLGRRAQLSALIGIPVLFFFAAAAGSTPSALRAAFMVAVPLLAPLAGREPDRPTALAAALALLLLPCPYAATSVSLQLSFSAVAGIYLVSGELSSRWLEAIPKWDGLWGKAARRALAFGACSVAVTVGALLFTTPLAALYFRSVSLVGPLSNLLTLWAVSFLFAGGLFCGILGLFLPAPATVLAWFVSWPARWILFVVRKTARFPFASVSLLSGYLVLWFAVAYLILLLWLLGRRRVRSLIPLSALLCSLCVSLLVSTWTVRTGALTVAALDVGQGSSTLLYSRGRSILVDCGGSGGDDPGDVAADYLQALGTSHLDTLILTHYHADHASGVPELLSRLQVSQLILPDVTPEEALRREILTLAEELDCEVLLLSKDSTLEFGGAKLTLFAPLGDGGANEEGLSLLCSAGDFDVLITGDMNSVVERRLLRQKTLPDIELLVVGHHGSRHSTSEELLLATRPETAVISSGYNSYGHPAPETLERLGAAGCDIYLTNWMGTVTFTVGGE